MNVTFRQLKMFLTLAETRSVTKTARILHVTQPTVSIQLKELAETIGMPLFEVISKQLFLTHAGNQLAETARLMMREWNMFEQNIQNQKGHTQGTLKLAVVSTAKYFIPKMLGTFCAQYPEIDIALEVLNRDGVIQRLEKNLDDFYIMSMPPNNIEIEDEIFMTNHLVMIGAKHHALAGQKRIQLADLAAEKFILREIGSGTRMATDIHFKAHQFTPNIRMELGSNEAIKQAVAGGLGVAVLSIHSLGDLEALNEVSILKVDGFPIQSNWHIVNLKGKRLSIIARTFHDHLLLEANHNSMLAV